MSELLFLQARAIRKSYIGGVWKPITKVPKAELKTALARGQVGQEHLHRLAAASNTIQHMAAGAVADQNKATATGKKVRNIFTGRKMDVVRDSGVAGPHALSHASKKGTFLYKPHSKQSMGEVKDEVKFQQRDLGVKFTSGRAPVTAHEHAHGTVKRRGVTRLAAWNAGVQQSNKSAMSRVEAVTGERLKGRFARFQQKPSASEKLSASTEWGTKYQQGMGRKVAGEESRADVMASRKLGRRVTSGHVLDTGEPKDYLNARNKIEDRMGVKRTKMSDIMREH